MYNKTMDAHFRTDIRSAQCLNITTRLQPQPCPDEINQDAQQENVDQKSKRRAVPVVSGVVCADPFDDLDD
jgi:hypothetical protein